MHNRLIAAAIILAFPPFPAAFGATQAVTGYTHDAAGNTTRIATENNVQAPAVDALDPNTVRRIAAHRIAASGSNLKNAQVASAIPGIQAETVSSTFGQVLFDLTAAESVAPGEYTLNFITRLGTAEATITVVAGLPPSLQAAPNPITMWRKNSNVDLQLTLSEADSFDHSVNLAVADPSIAQVSPTQIVLHKGDTVNTQPIVVTALSAGQTQLLVNASQLGTLQVPLTVVELAAGNYAPFTAMLGIVRDPEPVRPNNAVAQLGVIRDPEPSRNDNAYAQIGVIRDPEPTRDNNADAQLGIIRDPEPLRNDNAYAQIGIFWGTAVDSVTPSVLLAGSNNPLNLFGDNLQLVTQIELDPADGAIVDPAWDVSADGRQLTLHVTVAAGTPAGWRTLLVTGSKGPAVFRQPSGDRVEIR